MKGRHKGTAIDRRHRTKKVLVCRARYFTCRRLNTGGYIRDSLSLKKMITRIDYFIEDEVRSSNQKRHKHFRELRSAVCFLPIDSGQQWTY